MSRACIGAAALCVCSSLLFAQRQPQGIGARSSPSEYAAQTTVAGVTYAASLIPAKELKHLFPFDISKHYVVFELALYPGAGSHLDLNRDGFVAKTAIFGDPVRSADSITIASVIQQSNTPAQPPRMADVTVGSEVGYESGVDPYTGQRVHGTYTATQVGVSNRDNTPPLMPKPGSTPQDRDMLEYQLWERSLPGGQIHQAIAGYLYFPSSLLKKAHGTYYLEYAGSEPVLNNSASPQKIQLQIPTKTN